MLKYFEILTILWCKTNTMWVCYYNTKNRCNFNTKKRFIVIAKTLKFICYSPEYLILLLYKKPFNYAAKH